MARAAGGSARRRAARAEGGGVLKRPGDRRRERVDMADRRVRSRAWADAARELARDSGARVACPACRVGVVSGEWVPFRAHAGGEWVLQCGTCGAWYSEVRGGDRSG
jgi:hypothetical protein